MPTRFGRGGSCDRAKAVIRATNAARMRTVWAIFAGCVKNAGDADVPECASAFCFPGAACRSGGIALSVGGVVSERADAETHRTVRRSQIDVRVRVRP